MSKVTVQMPNGETREMDVEEVQRRIEIFEKRIPRRRQRADMMESRMNYLKGLIGA